MKLRRKDAVASSPETSVETEKRAAARGRAGARTANREAVEKAEVAPTETARMARGESFMVRWRGVAVRAIESSSDMYLCQRRSSSLLVLQPEDEG